MPPQPQESETVEGLVNPPAAEESEGEGEEGEEGEEEEGEGEGEGEAVKERGATAAESSSAAATGTTKKKKKRKKKGKAKAEQLPKGAVDDLLKLNPALASEFQGMDKVKIEELIKKLKLQDVATGLASVAKNQKDMASYKFWATQPVARFDEPDAERPDGPVQPINPDVPVEGPALLEGFEWVTVDLTDDAQMTEVYDLLYGHYVEDQEAMFRFNYSLSFLEWALMAPGWKQQWHVGVRVATSRKLVAFISGIPVKLRVRENVLSASEINFLCVHKKLRAKRLTPVLIKEITRRCNVEKVWNAIYTAGIILPKPVSTCRYFHRSINWQKLYEVGFSPLPPNSNKARQIMRYALPTQTKTQGLREMDAKDLPQVHNLLSRYLGKFDMAPQYDVEELEHWLLPKPGNEQVIWAYVVEDPATKKITDFFSFYALESSVIGNKKHSAIRAAYLFYYASETALDEGKTRKDLKIRLNELMHDALILAKSFDFDVFNALTLLDNTLFLQEQKFGVGDGQLHYYLFNWRTPFIRGGVDKNCVMDEENGSGVGMVML